MNTIVSFILLFVCGALAKPADPVQTNTTGVITPRAPTLLVAQADGKSFYADNTAYTWRVAKKVCVDAGMNLAAITSPNQLAALKGSTHPNFNGAYWTAGRDARTLRQMSWDRTNTEPGSFLAGMILEPLAYETCLYYDTFFGVDLNKCTNQCLVLCEI